MLMQQNCHKFPLLSKGVGYITMSQSDNQGLTLTLPNLVLVMCLMYAIKLNLIFKCDCLLEYFSFCHLKHVLSVR